MMVCPDPPGTLTYKWTKVSGARNGRGFANATVRERTGTVTFSAGGVYTLKLTVSDSVLSGSGYCCDHREQSSRWSTRA